MRNSPHVIIVLLMLALLIVSWTSDALRPVLVIGSTGKVGRIVVRKLLHQGVPTRAMARDIDKARAIFADFDNKDGNLSIIKGSATDDPESLSNAVEGCEAVIAVHGAISPTTIPMLLLPIFWFKDSPLNFGSSNHPYFTNYIAMKNLVTVSEKHGVSKIVRLTGLSCALPPFNPVSALFNALLSFSARYHRMGEVELLKSKIPVSILRPGGLSDEPRDPQKTTFQASLNGALPPPGRVGREDVAEAAVLSVLDDKLKRESYVAAVRWTGEVAPKTQGSVEEGSASVQEELTSKLVAYSPQQPPMPIVKQWKFMLAHATYVYAFFYVFVKFVAGIVGFAASKLNLLF